MYFEQFLPGCLAHASYLLASEGEAVVVDPERDVDMYLKAAEQHGLRIHHILRPICMLTLCQGTRNWLHALEPRSTSVQTAVPRFPTQKCKTDSNCASETCGSKFWRRLGIPPKASALWLQMKKSLLIPGQS